MPGQKMVIFTDIGDTIIDEATEVREVPAGIVYHASCIPGAKEAMLALYGSGHTIIMVADGLKESFSNTMQENGLSHIFAARVISEELGKEKPAPEMFEMALKLAGLTEADKNRIIMVGNNLSRDVLGANRFGITSVHLCWSPRYPHQASCPEEEPDYRIYHPYELLTLVNQLENSL